MIQGFEMRQLTPNEVWRTSLPYVDPKGVPGAIYLTSKDKNEMCVYCKNEETDVVKDPVELSRFKSFYGGRKFRVCYCACCDAVFSFAYPNE